MKKRCFAALLALALLAGCGQTSPAPSASSAPSDSGAPATPEEPVVHVHTDYSALEDPEPGQPDVGDRWYEDYQSVLQPRDDYGDLIPFPGARTYYPDPWNGETYECSNLYGLMTVDGKVVLDPVYVSISNTAWTDDALDTHYWPVWQLGSGRGWGEDLAEIYAFAARDGSWVTDFIYLGWTDLDGQILAGTEDALHLLDPDTGEVLRVWDLAGFGLSGEDFSWNSWEVTESSQMTPWGLMIDYEMVPVEGGWSSEGINFLDLETGVRTRISEEEWNDYFNQRFTGRSGWWEVRLQNGEATVSYGSGQHTEPRASFPAEGLPDDAIGYVDSLWERFVIFQSYTEEPWCAVYTLDGEAVVPVQQGQVSQLTDYTAGPGQPAYFAVNVLGEDHTVIWNEQGEEVFSIPEEEPWLLRYGDLVQVDYDSPTIEAERSARVGFYRLDTGACVFYRNLGIGD